MQKLVELAKAFLKPSKERVLLAIVFGIAFFGISFLSVSVCNEKLPLRFFVEPLVLGTSQFLFTITMFSFFFLVLPYLFLGFLSIKKTKLERIPLTVLSVFGSAVLFLFYWFACCLKTIFW
ncbi:MAG: hypothetical protein QXK06_05940 [Candidatus Diapherotrites archaeon]